MELQGAVWLILLRDTQRSFPSLRTGGVSRVAPPQRHRLRVGSTCSKAPKFPVSWGGQLGCGRRCPLSWGGSRSGGETQHPNDFKQIQVVYPREKECLWLAGPQTLVRSRQRGERGSPSEEKHESRSSGKWTEVRRILALPWGLHLHAPLLLLLFPGCHFLDSQPSSSSPSSPVPKCSGLLQLGTTTSRLPLCTPPE